MTSDVSRRAFLASWLAAMGGMAVADAPLTALRPTARPGSSAAAPAPAPETGTGGPDRPGDSPPPRPDFERMVAEANLGGMVGFAVAEARSGRLRAARLADVPLPPASTAKALTALYGLERLGPEHRFVTRVLHTGTLRADGILEGDLILAGGGDPLLDTADMVEMTAELRAAGVRGITGRFLTWGGALTRTAEIAPEQDDHLGYNPAVSGLNLNFNRVYFVWQRQGSSYDVILDARQGDVRPAVSMARMRVVDRSLPVYTYEDRDGIDSWTVARGRLGNEGSRWLPVKQPEAYAADVFRTLAREAGVSLPLGERMQAPPPAGAVELVVRQSAPLEEIIRGMLLYSTNITAEIVGAAASSAGSRPVPQTLRASAAQMNLWLGVESGAESGLVDHSGLSDMSRISAGDFVQALVAAGPDSALRPLLKDIPLTDENGEALRFARGEVEAKTGTLNFVSALAGYMRTVEGDDLVFAILCANMERRAVGLAQGEEIPEGARPWNRRARRLQQRLLQHWGLMGV